MVSRNLCTGQGLPALSERQGHLSKGQNNSHSELQNESSLPRSKTEKNRKLRKTDINRKI